MMTMPSLTRRTPIGIDVDARCITAVQLTAGPSHRRVVAATMLSRLEPTPVPTDAEVRRLLGVLERQNFLGRTVVLAVPAHMLMSGVLELPAAGSGAPRDQITCMELARMHRCGPTSFEFAFWDLPARERAGEGAEAMAAACTIDDAGSILDVFEAEGFDVLALDLQSLAGARACAPVLAGHDGMAVLLNLRWDTASLAIVHRKAIVYFRLLPESGLLALHEALIQRLQLDPESAEFMILEGGLGDGAVADELLAGARRLIIAHLEGLMHEVEVSCSYVAHRYPEAATRSMCLLGPGAAIPGLQEHLESGLGGAAKPVSPAMFVQCPEELSMLCINPALTTAAGLALHGV